MTEPDFTFEYDLVKAVLNLGKHGISFTEAASVFGGDPSAYTDFDPDHSASDRRFFTIGYSSSGKLLHIVHN
jgi:uncharacterized DUF497 family protein